MFHCPVCGRVSHHPEDERQGYCGACKQFTRDLDLRLRVAAQQLAEVTGNDPSVMLPRVLALAGFPFPTV